MNLIKKGVGYTVITSMLLTSAMLPFDKASASELENQESTVVIQQQANPSILSDYEINLLDPYVNFDFAGKTFSIISEASTELSPELYTKLENQISLANAQIQQLDLNSQAETQIPQAMAAAKYVNGKTDIDFHWWGATVYLSRNTLIGLGGGIAIGGLWIPEPVISKVLGSLGIALGTAASITGGVKFDYKYIGVLPAMLPFAISNVSFQ
ncbi:hypothetical protein [Lysinibacillus capsici]|uniref:hypothetical protein n=1 Tax=Lysinibacillus capsici TaxID=2115968 RepID=UPI000E208232|nr:hypothetical protein [Lysinibacillus capsici]RDV27736.1 hypothetical protein C7B89_19330 [Lysinibacillus capsici]